jgi:Lon protease-like protein
MLPWNAEDLIFDETRFSGLVRLFPLPDLVMFPHVMQPLHIFEPRYRDMLNDALDGDGLIAMAMLAPSRSADCIGRPAIFPQVCLGKVVTHQRLPDGRYNIMLLGSKRARIVRETPSGRLFRRAEVELIEDAYPSAGEGDRAELQNELTAQFQKTLPLSKGASTASAVHELLAAELPLGVLTDLVAFATPLEASLKRALLAECNVDRRAQTLLAALRDEVEPRPVAAQDARRRFPPRFSAN